MSGKPSVDTAKVTDRRALTFESFEAVGRDLDALEAAHRAGTLRTTGNWTAGQVFNHLANWAGYPFEGYPADVGAPPAIIRLILRFFKKKYCFGKMPVGVKIPGVKAGTVGQEDGPVDAGLGRLRRAIARLDSTAPTMPSPVFGLMTHEEWKGLNLRHCELHMSFLHPR